MKKLLFTLAVLLLSVGAQAQEELTYGARLQLGATMYSGDGADNMDSSPSLTAAFVMDYRFADNFSLLAEPGIALNYVQVISTIDKGFRTSDLGLNFFQVPIMLNYYPVESLGLNVKAGIQPQYLLWLSNPDKHDFSKSDFKSFVMSVPVGVGYSFNSNLSVDVRYAFGITPIYKIESYDLSQHTLTVGASWMF